LLVINTALFKKTPYRNVVATGMMLDENGKKLSKRKKNYPPLNEVLDDLGADVLRFFILNSPIVQAEAARFSKNILIETKKSFILPLWNSLKFFVTYANLRRFRFDKSKRIESVNPLDVWVLARVSQTVEKVKNALAAYNILKAVREFEPLVSDLSTWYIRRSRDRFRAGDREAFDTLFLVLSDLAKLISPFTPFLGELIYQALDLEKVEGQKSVHLSLYPKARKLSASDKALIKEMKFVREVVEKGHSERKIHGIRVRQPLPLVTVKSSRSNLGDYFVSVIKDELNVKGVSLQKGLKKKELEVSLDTNLTKELKMEGLAREMVRSIQELRKEKGISMAEKAAVEYEDTKESREVVEHFRTYIMEKAGLKSIEPGKELKLI
ncbi:class I tRNA ligase family protein, partial [candidate division WWE3 bacterium]|nr:class I tRNA ligase family protein [candidate division WWE3 bacterium]